MPPKERIVYTGAYERAQQTADRNRRGRLFRQFSEGAAFRFMPRPGVQGPDPRAGEEVVVVRPPRNDVQDPSIRVRFADGEERSVKPRALQSLAPARELWPADERAPAPSPELEHARSFPAWERALNILDLLHDEVRRTRRHDAELLDMDLLEADAAGIDLGAERVKPSAAELELQTDAQRRLAQLAALVLPKGASSSEREKLATQLRAQAVKDAQTRRAARPGRAGQPLISAAAPRPARRDVPTPGELTQDNRRMVNVIARCIHLRYFISDAAGERLTEEEKREKAAFAKQARMIRTAQKDEGMLPVTQRRVPVSAAHGQLLDANRELYAAALEACQALTAGKEARGRALLERFKDARADVLRAQAEVQALRPAIEAGRYFHGDILSVRDEHVVYDEDGTFLGYEGMTQYYTRLTVIHSGDGFTLEVANGLEIEARTSTQVGESGWRDLCRWMKDHAERDGGQHQGRRQDDDRHLIYREQDGVLTLRESVRRRYPGLPLALEAVRRSLDPGQSDVLDEEIPEPQPERGFHPPRTRGTAHG